MRDFDFVMAEHDTLVGLGGLAADITSGLITTVVGGLVASQTSIASLTINIASGRIYQFAASDAVAVGSIPQDLSTIVQQGEAAAQTVTLVPPSAGQSQWNLIQAQFSQVDAVRDNDPNGGIIPFYNAANTTQPISNSVSSVRKAICVIQVITGSAATTGSEVPPQPTNGWVPLYLVDLAGGQTGIITSQIIKTGPGVGTGVPSNYPSAPFLAGLLAAHHNGQSGQAPKINLVTEVQGVLPYANMSTVRIFLTGNLTLYVNTTTGSDTNQGTSPATAFKTIQAAVNSMYHNYDFNGFVGTISVANGTYAVTSGPSTSVVSFIGLPVGASAVNLVGNVASKGSVILAATNGNVIGAFGNAIINMSGFTVSASGTNIGIVATAGYGIVSNQGAYVTVSSVGIGACGTAQMSAGIGGTIIVTGSGNSLTGATQYGLVAKVGGTVWMSGALLTITGLAASVACYAATQSSSVVALGCNFSGTCTGPRHNANLNGTITTNGSFNAYWPGSSAGSTATGGQVV